MNFKQKIKFGLARRLFSLDQDFALAPLCQRHLDRSLDQNDDRMEVNGELFFLECCARLLPEGIVFDVGANEGAWARKAIALGPSWVIHCFEPNPATYAKLQTALPPVSARLTLHPIGFSTEAAEAELHNFAVDSGMSSLYERSSIIASRRFEMQTKTVIRLDTVDNFCRAHGITGISLLKIDTEGNEQKVLMGAQNLLRENKINAIQFEYGGCWIDARVFLMDVWEMLAAFGYQLFKLSSGGLIACPRYDASFENFQYCNYAALAPRVTWPPAYLRK